MDYTALRAELLTDPLTTAAAAGWNTGSGYLQPYASLTDADAAQKLNATDTGRTQRRPDVTSKEIIEAIAIADFPELPPNPNAGALSTERRSLSYLEMLVNTPTVRMLADDGSNMPVIENLQNIFPPGTGTRNRLIAMATRVVSRQQELGLGVVSEVDVNRARSGVW